METTIGSTQELTDAELDKIAEAEERFALLGERLGRKLARWQKELQAAYVLGSDSARLRVAKTDAVDGFLALAQDAEFVHWLGTMNTVSKASHAREYGRLSRKALGRMR